MPCSPKGGIQEIGTTRIEYVPMDHDLSDASAAVRAAIICMKNRLLKPHTPGAIFELYAAPKDPQHDTVPTPRWGNLAAQKRYEWLYHSIRVDFLVLAHGSIILVWVIEYGGSVVCTSSELALISLE